MRSSLHFENFRRISLPKQCEFKNKNAPVPGHGTGATTDRTPKTGFQSPCRHPWRIKPFSTSRPWLVCSVRTAPTSPSLAKVRVPFVALPRWAILGINASLESNRRALRRVKSFSKDQLEVRFRIVSRARRQISAAAGSSNSRSSFHLSLVHSSK